MASPVFHGLAGAGLADAMAGDARRPLFSSVRKAGPWLLAGLALACLPDVDYLPGLWRGYLNTTHQQATHGVAWVLTTSGGIWLVGRAWRPAWFGGRMLAFLLILIGRHLAIDLLAVVRMALYGFSFGGRFSGGGGRGPFALLPAWEKTALADMGSWNNLRTLGIELGAGLAFAAGCGIAKRLRTALG